MDWTWIPPWPCLQVTLLRAAAVGPAFTATLAHLTRTGLTSLASAAVVARTASVHQPPPSRPAAAAIRLHKSPPPIRAASKLT